MRIGAVLCWYDEPLEFLHRCARSLAGRVDDLIAVDGRWSLHADYQPALSPREQTDVLQMVGRELDLRVHLVTHKKPWPSQVAKRDWAMHFASDGCDWLLVIDGDEHIEQFDRAAVEAALAATELDVAEVTMRNLNRPHPLRHLAPQAFPVRRLYRAGTQVVGPAHNDYERNGQRLNGDTLHGPLAPALDLADVVIVAHDNRNRGEHRNLAAQGYRRLRQERRIEARA